MTYNVFHNGNQCCTCQKQKKCLSKSEMNFKRDRLSCLWLQACLLPQEKNPFQGNFMASITIRQACWDIMGRLRTEEGLKGRGDEWAIYYGDTRFKLHGINPLQCPLLRSCNRRARRKKHSFLNACRDLLSWKKQMRVTCRLCDGNLAGNLSNK